jgi:hypothetical protein
MRARTVFSATSLTFFLAGLGFAQTPQAARRTPVEKDVIVSVGPGFPAAG